MSDCSKCRGSKGHIIKGTLGGLIGGIVFGIMMGMVGMLPMIAMLIKSENSTAGFIIHLVISIVLGIIFSLVFGKMVKCMMSGSLYGLLYGLLWWFLGPLLLMPLMMGGGTNFDKIGDPVMISSLWGHLAFGLILGLVYGLLVGMCKKGICEMVDEESKADHNKEVLVCGACGQAPCGCDADTQKIDLKK